MTTFRLIAAGLLALSASACEQRQASSANPPGTAAERAVDRAGA